MSLGANLLSIFVPSYFLTVTKENAEYAYLDEALWNLLKEKNKRDEFRQLIIRTYLS